jgi:hypothetical protein
MSADFVRLVAASLKAEKFTLVDVGCSGGIDAQWRLFGDRLAAVGFDASVSECRRLSAAETNPNVRYVPGFVDIPPDHPFARIDGPKWRGHVGNFFEETSASWTRELRAERLKTAPDSEKWLHNMWGATELADPDKPVYVPQVLDEIGISDVDMLKIDVDGPDFRILNSFDGLFKKFGIIAARMEVNPYGGPDPTAHLFHNTDRYMRQQGYTLVRLDCYHYSKRALPARYTNTGASHTQTGRLFQAEAHYAVAPPVPLTAEKLIKLAAIFSLWNQPDGAAEILVEFRDRIAPVLDVDAALDLLAAQTQANVGVQQPLSYRDYMALFATDSPYFFPSEPSTPAAMAPAVLEETIDTIKGDLLPDRFLKLPWLQEGASIRGRAAVAPYKPVAIADKTIDTTTVPHTYSVVWKVDTSALPQSGHDRTIVVEVSIDVGAGRLGILWVDENFQPIGNGERHVAVDPHRQRVLVAAPVSRARYLVVRNSAREGLASSFVVKCLRGKITPS